MRKSDYIVFIIFDSIYLFASAVVSNLLGSLIIKFVEKIIDLPFWGEAVVHASSVLVGMIVMMAIMAYGDGYRYAMFDAKGTMLSAVVAAVVHFGLGAVLRFAPAFFGPVRHFSGLVAYGMDYTSERVVLIPKGLMIAVGIGAVVAYVAVVVLASSLGCRKRLRDREQLMAGQSTSK